MATARIPLAKSDEPITIELRPLATEAVPRASASSLVACVPLPIAIAPVWVAKPLNAKEREPLAIASTPNATDSDPLAVVDKFAAKEFAPVARVFSPIATEPYPMFAGFQYVAP